MANLIITETDTASDLSYQAAGTCSATATQTGAISRKATSGGTAGVTATTITMASSASRAAFVNFYSAANEPNLTTWTTSGTWTVRIEITTANTNASSAGADCIKVDSAGGLIYCGAQSGGLLSFGTTGVKSDSPVAQPDVTANATDRLLVQWVVTNGAMNSQSFAFKPSQNIDTPLSASTFSPDEDYYLQEPQVLFDPDITVFQ